MRFSLLLCLAFAAVCLVVDADKPERKSFWRRISSPLAGLCTRGKKTLASVRKSLVSRKRSALEGKDKPQSKLEEGVKTATGVLDDLVAEAESKSDHAAHAMKDEAQRTADSVKEAMASSTEKISSASAATQSAVEHGTEEASKEADAAVGDMADLSKQRQDAAQQEKAAAEKAKEADVEL